MFFPKIVKDGIHKNTDHKSNKYHGKERFHDIKQKVENSYDDEKRGNGRNIFVHTTNDCNISKFFLSGPLSSKPGVSIINALSFVFG